MKPTSERWRITLEFDDKGQRDYTCGQITDGWGESVFEIEEYPPDKKASTITYHVDIAGDEYWQYHLKVKKKHPDWFPDE